MAKAVPVRFRPSAPLGNPEQFSLLGNATEARCLDHFTEGLSQTYTRMAKALKSGAPLAFTLIHCDTVFVCRSTGSMPRKWLFQDETRIAAIVADDLARLRESGMEPTQGDTRCTSSVTLPAWGFQTIHTR